jgi:hypothetical protein
MKMSSLIYTIAKSLPKKQTELGRLTIEIHFKTRQLKGLIFNWKCDFMDKRNAGWYDCQLQYRSENLFDLLFLLPLLQKIEEADLYDATQVKEVINFLHLNQIEHAIKTKVHNAGGKVFDGYISVSEIIAGEFENENFEKPFKIPPSQQKKLLNQILKERNIKIR